MRKQVPVLYAQRIGIFAHLFTRNPKVPDTLFKSQNILCIISNIPIVLVLIMGRQKFLFCVNQLKVFIMRESTQSFHHV